MNHTAENLHTPEQTESSDKKWFFNLIVNEVLAYLKKKIDGDNGESDVINVTTTDHAEQTPDLTQNLDLKTDAEKIQSLMNQPLMDKVKDEKELFATQLYMTAKNLKTKPEWLLAVMDTETAETLDPSKQNPWSGATWLIQFMPDTARGLGTSTAALKWMSRVEQLPYVEKYFKNLGLVGKLNTLEDVYLGVFFPAAVGHSDDPNYVFEAKGLSASRVAKSNPLFNPNRDKEIRMSEFSSYVKNTLAAKINYSGSEANDTYYA